MSICLLKVHFCVVSYVYNVTDTFKIASDIRDFKLSIYVILTAFSWYLYDIFFFTPSELFVITPFTVSALWKMMSVSASTYLTSLTQSLQMAFARFSSTAYRVHAKRCEMPHLTTDQNWLTPYFQGVYLMVVFHNNISFLIVHCKVLIVLFFAHLKLF